MLKRWCLLALFTLFATSFSFTQAQDKKDAGKQPATQRPNYDAIYKLGPDAKKQDGVPEGKLSSKQTFRGKLYDNTEHDYWVYLPHDLDKSKPAKLMVFLDGNNYANPNGPVRISSCVRQPDPSQGTATDRGRVRDARRASR
jgi:acetyl esterase/lipase